MVFPIRLETCWQCFKHVYYCPNHSFTQSISYRVVRGSSGWFNAANFRLSNSFPWSYKIRFGNPKSRKKLLNNKSAAALKMRCLLFIGFFVSYAFTFFSGVVNNDLFITWPINTLSTKSYYFLQSEMTHIFMEFFIDKVTIFLW